jgi:hypothetical protein
MKDYKEYVLDQSSLFFGGRKKKKEDIRIKSSSSLHAGMLAVVHWASVLRPFAQCLLVQSSIQSVIQVWI